MLRMVKWSLPVLAFGLMVALSGVRAGGAEDAAAKSEKVKISGVVMLEDGSPAATARVRLLPAGGMKKDGDKADKGADKPAPQAADGEKPAEGDKPKGRRVEPIAETTTDAEGKFSVEVPAGKYRLNATLKGSGNASKTITVKSGEPMDDVELKLKPAKKGAAAAQ